MTLQAPSGEIAIEKQDHLETSPDASSVDEDLIIEEIELPVFSRPRTSPPPLPPIGLEQR